MTNAIERIGAPYVPERRESPADDYTQVLDDLSAASVHRNFDPYLDIDWDGSEMLLQSRAHDETGYVQPTKAQLREVRGLNSVYHNNCIQTWHVNTDGSAENVEVS